MMARSAEVQDIARGFDLTGDGDPSIRGAKFMLMVERMREAGVAVPFTILSPEGHHAGHIAATLRDITNGKLTLGYWVLPEFRGQGLASDALRTLSDWCLDKDGVHRLNLFIETWNQPSARAALSAGFEYEATLKKWEFVGGEPHDMMVYARFS